tara:strand:- start:678 stop:1703 length:1026 start_codon:yes stop_codon:yes gene_type:complete
VSLARALKLSKGYHKLKNYALLDFTEAEAYLTFFQNDLPVFNRYLTVLKKDEDFDLESFVESVNFSFQYFKREFKAYDLEKFIIISNADTEKFISPLREGLQVVIEKVSPYDLTNRDNAELENVKALGASQVGLKYYKFKPNLRKTEERLHPARVAAAAGAPLKKGMLFGIAVACLIPSIFLSIILDNKVGEKDFKLKKMEKKIIVPSSLKSLSWEKRAERTALEEKKMKKLKKTSKELTKFSGFFETLSKRENLPSGLWLDEVKMEQRRLGKGERGLGVIISGYIFLDDNYKEDTGVDEFVFILKKNDKVRINFDNVELESSDRVEIDSFKVTKFSIKLY